MLIKDIDYLISKILIQEGSTLKSTFFNKNIYARVHERKSYGKFSVSIIRKRINFKNLENPRVFAIYKNSPNFLIPSMKEKCLEFSRDFLPEE